MRPRGRIAAAFCIGLCAVPAVALSDPPAGVIAEVDPFIGVDGDGNTMPGATVPFGFAKPSPDMAPATEFRFDTSGYQSDKPIIGFSQTHVSGTGGESKYGNFRITPQVGALRPGALASPKASEEATPGYYAVMLTGPGVKAELTATRLVAVHRYTFPPTKQARLLIDTGSVIFTGGGAGRRQRPIATRTRIVGGNRIEGTGHFIGGWNPSPYTLHFTAEASRPFQDHGVWRGDISQSGEEAITGEQGPAGAYLTFDTTRNRTVEIKIGLSFVSTDKAAQNIRSETGDAGFDEIRARASALWNDALSKISVEGGTRTQRMIFRTALYRAHHMPHDLTGENAWWRSDEPHYEDYYAIWDTFRTVHPLLTLIQPDRQRDMLRSLIDTYRHTGWLPDARVAGANGMVQGGSNADVLIADAFVKGLTGIDYETAYTAMVKNAEVDSPRPYYEGRELGDYPALGYLSSAYERSASRTLEYAYNDFAIAQVACGLGKAEDHRKYSARSRGWAKLWDPQTRAIRPRAADGSWMTPFDKSRLYMLENPRFTWMSAPYYEGSAYQYSTYVPHDVSGLIAKVGSAESFVRWLDVFFRAAKSDAPLRDEGLYSHVNEPDIHAAFLYIHAGRPDRTQDRVRRIMAEEYRTGRDGLPGNDDAGTISAWYAWNAIGLYPNAGQDHYYIGSPIFRRSTIKLGGGRTFVVRADASSDANRYIASATLNGAPLDRAWLRHSEIAAGGSLVLRMTDRSSNWGSAGPSPTLANAARECAGDQGKLAPAR